MPTKRTLLQTVIRVQVFLLFQKHMKEFDVINHKTCVVFLMRFFSDSPCSFLDCLFKNLVPGPRADWSDDENRVRALCSASPSARAQHVLGYMCQVSTQERTNICISMARDREKTYDMQLCRAKHRPIYQTIKSQWYLNRPCKVPIQRWILATYQLCGISQTQRSEHVEFAGWPIN